MSLERFDSGLRWEKAAARLNALVDAVNGILGSRGDGRVLVSRNGDSGLTFGLNMMAVKAACARGPHPKAWYKVLTNVGAGAYTVRRVYWDEATTTLVEVGNTDNEYSVPAKDVLAGTSMVAGDIVAGWWAYNGATDGGIKNNLIVDKVAVAAGGPFRVWTIGHTEDNEYTVVIAKWTAVGAGLILPNPSSPGDLLTAFDVNERDDGLLLALCWAWYMPNSSGTGSTLVADIPNIAFESQTTWEITHDGHTYIRAGMGTVRFIGYS